MLILKIMVYTVGHKNRKKVFSDNNLFYHHSLFSLQKSFKKKKLQKQHESNKFISWNREHKSKNEGIRGTNVFLGIREHREVRF